MVICSLLRKSNLQLGVLSADSFARDGLNELFLTPSRLLVSPSPYPKLKIWLNISYVPIPNSFRFLMTEFHIWPAKRAIPNFLWIHADSFFNMPNAFFHCFLLLYINCSLNLFKFCDLKMGNFWLDHPSCVWVIFSCDSNIMRNKLYKFSLFCISYDIFVVPSSVFSFNWFLKIFFFW